MEGDSVAPLESNGATNAYYGSELSYRIWYKRIVSVLTNLFFAFSVLVF